MFIVYKITITKSIFRNTLQSVYLGFTNSREKEKDYLTNKNLNSVFKKNGNNWLEKDTFFGTFEVIWTYMFLTLIIKIKYYFESLNLLSCNYLWFRDFNRKEICVRKLWINFEKVRTNPLYKSDTFVGQLFVFYCYFYQNNAF